MNSTVATPAVSTEAIAAAWAKHVEAEHRRGGSFKRKHIYASSRRKCLRRSVLEATEPESFPEFDAEARARMLRGSQRERDIMIDLMRVGRHCEPRFDVEGSQERIEIKDRKGRVIITGKIDGFIHWGDSRAKWPAEVKTWAPMTTDRIHRFADLFDNKWTWSGAFQLLAYLYAKNEPRGILILDRPGIPKLIEVELEPYLAAMEAFLRDAETAVNHIEVGTLPDFINDVSECRTCPAFGAACNPPTSYAGARVLTDPEFIRILERRHELEAAADEFDHLDKEAKKILRGVESAIAGPFVVSGKWGKSTTYEMPEDVKKQYAKVDPKGKFTVEITKV